MRYPYVVILKKTGQRATDLLSILLCLISAFCFGFIGLHAFDDFATGAASNADLHHQGFAETWMAMFLAFVLLVGLAVTLFLRRRIGSKRIRFRYVLLFAALGWLFFTPVPWVGALFLALAFLEAQTKRPLEIGFDTDQVVINTLIKQRFSWDVFNNVILKDGLLTLDFKSNRLIQKEVADDDEDDDADEDEFNAYCRDRLAAADRAAAIPS